MLSLQLPGNIKVKPFETIHRVRSQGYVVYKVKKTLRAEYQGQPSQTISSLVKEGADIFNFVTSPEVAYTGLSGNEAIAIYNDLCWTFS